MKETTPAAMPPCFEKWCQRFDDVFTHKAQKREFRHPPRGIVGRKREKKPISDGRKRRRGDLPSFTSLFNRSTLVWFKDQGFYSKNRLEDKTLKLLQSKDSYTLDAFALGLRRRWASKPLNTFAEALEAFRTAISFRFVDWLTLNRNVFAAYKASLGFIWT
jgi:hypothetical protein